MKKLILLTLAAVFLSAGCSSSRIPRMWPATKTTYEYIAPTTPEGLSCISQCTNTRSACYAKEDEWAENKNATCQDNAFTELALCQEQAVAEYNICTRTSSENYRTCTRSNSSPQPNCVPEKCTLRTCTQKLCNTTANYSTCNQNYRACYTSCGGQVIAHEDPNPYPGLR